MEARAAFGDEAAGGLFRRGGVSGSHGTGGAARPSFYPNTGTGERVWKGKDDASRGVAFYHRDGRKIMRKVLEMRRVASGSGAPVLESSAKRTRR